MNLPLGLHQIENLNGSNFKQWKRDIELHLGMIDFDHVLKEDPPAEPTPTTSKEVKDKYHQWHKHNRLTLVILKKFMTDAVRGGIPESEYAREYFKNVEEKFKVSDKAEIGNLMNTLITMKFDGVGSIREYIMKGIDVAAKLKVLNVSIEDTFLVHLLLHSLPQQYSQMQSNYNTQKESWSVNELISICVQEEDIVKKGKSIGVNLVSTPQFKKKFSYRPNQSGTSSSKVSQGTSQGSSNFKNFKNGFVKCFFCRKPSHVKKDCKGFKDWLIKKGISKKEDTK
ncbi:uncharacterized protein LOC133720766 [Rosa rugosa]|uniref:uncharacterized protein LOC133720766 n=1 Tax=Rosa rugosa TaxID=74645 RepID=UPI002B409E4F|nr:uncharacterized protein LOC133720766 [Rosa rugosa]